MRGGDSGLASFRPTSPREERPAARRHGRKSHSRDAACGHGRRRCRCTKCSCRSGRSSAGSDFRKAPPSAQGVAIMPVPSLRHCRICLSSLSAPRTPTPDHVGILRRPGHDEIEMVLQIVADAGQFVDDRNSVHGAVRPPGRRRTAAAAAASRRRRRTGSPRGERRATVSAALAIAHAGRALAVEARCRVACAPVMTVRFGRCIAGCR